MKKKLFLRLNGLLLNSVFLAGCNLLNNKTYPPNLPNDKAVLNPNQQKTNLSLVAKNINESNFVYYQSISDIPVAYVITKRLKIINLNPKIAFFIISITPKKNNTTVGIVKYRLFDSSGNSNELTQEICGFKSEAAEIASLNEIAKNVKNLKFINNKENIDFTKLNQSDFVFKNLPSGYKLKINKFTNINVIKNSFNVQYQIFKNKKIKSGVYFTTLDGFTFKWKETLNLIAKEITLDYDGDKIKTLVKNIDKTKIIFKNLDTENFIAKVINVNSDPNDSDIAVIKYLVKLKNNLSDIYKSDQVTKKISGFLKI